MRELNPSQVKLHLMTTQSRINGAVRGAYSQLWITIIPIFSPYAPRKYDKRFGTPAIVVLAHLQLSSYYDFQILFFFRCWLISLFGIPFYQSA